MSSNGAAFPMDSEKHENPNDYSPSPRSSYSGEKLGKSTPRSVTSRTLRSVISLLWWKNTTNLTIFQPSRSAPLSNLPTKAENIKVTLLDLKISRVRHDESKDDKKVHVRVSVRPTVKASCTGPDGEELTATQVGWSTGAKSSAICTADTLVNATTKAVDQATKTAFEASYRWAAASAVMDVQAQFARKARKAIYSS